MELAGKKVLIVGAARSGIAAARFLLAQGAIVALTDQKPIGKGTPEGLGLKGAGGGVGGGAGARREAGCCINWTWSSLVRAFRRRSFRFVTLSVRARKSSARSSSPLVI